jgi:hypothetical protein
MTVYLRDIEDEEVYDELRNALNSKELILFAGAGLSAQAKTDDGRHPPSWRGLLEGMVAYCRHKHWIDPLHAEEIQNLINAGYLIDAGQELQEVLQPSHLQQCVGEVTFCNLAKTGEVHDLVVQIPFRVYLTTNYDELIEGAYRAHAGVNLKKFYERTIEGVFDAFRERKNFIIKLHGDISDPSSIILGERSYERLLYANNAYRSCLESIFFVSSVLFIGFGAADPDIERIISKVGAFDGRSKRHWMLVPKGSFPLLRAKRLWTDKGITIIQYERDPSHSGLLTFLKALSTLPPWVPSTHEDSLPSTI